MRRKFLVVLSVLLQGEDVDAEGSHGVEEGKHTDGDEELCRGRVVTNQEETLGGTPFTGWGVKVYLVKPEEREEDEDGDRGARDSQSINENTYTLLDQKYVDTSSNEWIWLLQPQPLLTDV